jgi:signal transduction histidine kinase
VLGNPTIHREDLVAAAWDVVHEHGLLALSLPALAEQLGVPTEAVTEVFADELAVYDAMYAEGQTVFLEIARSLPATDDPRQALRQHVHNWARVATDDPERHQLLFQRTIPGFEPSPQSYAVAVEMLEHMRSMLRNAGITDPAHTDLLTGVMGGMVSQQLANDPGGDRWLRLMDEALDVYLDMRDSRQRLVAAQDSERRRIERDLHDGAQQHLVALKVQAGLARTMAEREGATRTADLLAAFAGEVGEALDQIRELARGIYPPLLAAEGIIPALAAAAARSTLPVHIDACAIGRHPEEYEAAVYFCCLEALQNVAKYAGASAATVRICVEDGALVFSVDDDGKGFDTAITPRGSGSVNMADRVGALGGTLLVRSEPGAGTTVTGRIPLGGPDVR